MPTGASSPAPAAPAAAGACWRHRRRATACRAAASCWRAPAWPANPGRGSASQRANSAIEQRPAQARPEIAQNCRRQRVGDQVGAAEAERRQPLIGAHRRVDEPERAAGSGGAEDGYAAPAHKPESARSHQRQVGEPIAASPIHRAGEGNIGRIRRPAMVVSPG